MAIIYTEKGAGLHAAIIAAGHRLVQQDGVWVSDDDAAVQAIIDGYSLAAAAAEVCVRIDQHASTLREKVTGGTSAGEMASWPIKRAEAEAYFVSSSAPTPFLSGEAAARGVPVADIAIRVMQNAAALQMLECQIAGNAGKHKDAVHALTTFDAVLTYDWSAGWPSV